MPSTSQQTAGVWQWRQMSTSCSRSSRQQLSTAALASSRPTHAARAGSPPWLQAGCVRAAIETWCRTTACAAYSCFLTEHCASMHPSMDISSQARQLVFSPSSGGSTATAWCGTRCLPLSRAFDLMTQDVSGSSPACRINTQHCRPVHLGVCLGMLGVCSPAVLACLIRAGSSLWTSGPPLPTKH